VAGLDGASGSISVTSAGGNESSSSAASGSISATNAGGNESSSGAASTAPDAGGAELPPWMWGAVPLAWLVDWLLLPLCLRCWRRRRRPHPRDVGDLQAPKAAGPGGAPSVPASPPLTPAKVAEIPSPVRNVACSGARPPVPGPVPAGAAADGGSAAANEGPAAANEGPAAAPQERAGVREGGAQVGEERDAERADGASRGDTTPSDRGDLEGEAEPQECDDAIARAEQLLAEPWVSDESYEFVIFEEERDELEHHRRRSGALGSMAAGFVALRAENDRLREAGACLLEDFEKLHWESRQAAGDVAYWRTLAEESVAATALAGMATPRERSGKGGDAATGGAALGAHGNPPERAKAFRRQTWSRRRNSYPPSGASTCGPQTCINGVRTTDTDALPPSPTTTDEGVRATGTDALPPSPTTTDEGVRAAGADAMPPSPTTTDEGVRTAGSDASPPSPSTADEGARTAGSDASPPSPATTGEGVRTTSTDAMPPSPTATGEGVRTAGSDASPPSPTTADEGVRTAGSDASPPSPATSDGGADLLTYLPVADHNR